LHTVRVLSTNLDTLLQNMNFCKSLFKDLPFLITRFGASEKIITRCNVLVSQLIDSFTFFISHNESEFLKNLKGNGMNNYIAGEGFANMNKCFHTFFYKLNTTYADYIHKTTEYESYKSLKNLKSNEKLDKTALADFIEHLKNLDENDFMVDKFLQEIYRHFIENPHKHACYAFY
ncbi:hypothetical protein HEP_00524300, partial [Hepatocystis sp. ex Piliocolobus tephrosceles]